MIDGRLQTNMIFGTPTWRFAVPEMHRFHDEIKGRLRELWRQGYFSRHGSGYGYQTREELFTPANLEHIEYLRVLKKAFVEACQQILASRHGHSKGMPFDIYCIQGWVLIQTNESWVDGPWHHHHPATLSGCYYIQVPQTRDPAEGLLMFQRPEPNNIFCENMAAVRPMEGCLTIFPSYLMHRPTPTPTATDWRIGICMDAFVHWHKRFEDPLRQFPDEESYVNAHKESLPGR
jgi:hypothetical protein